jgi:hypothetical protein
MNYFNLLPSAAYSKVSNFFTPTLTVQPIQIEQSHYGKHIGSFYFKGKKCLAANKLSIFHPIPFRKNQKEKRSLPFCKNLNAYTQPTPRQELSDC